jgi:hypothetical protein
MQTSDALIRSIPLAAVDMTQPRHILKGLHLPSRGTLTAYTSIPYMSAFNSRLKSIFGIVKKPHADTLLLAGEHWKHEFIFHLADML